MIHTSNFTCMKLKNIDFDENKILDYDSKILETLLIDRTTKRNILWCTDDYSELGDSYSFKSELLISLITGKNSGIIKPRILKTSADQKFRSKIMAEVFTPSWMCNRQINKFDKHWFGYDHVFNHEGTRGWRTNKTKISFSNKKWEDYVKLQRLEITCGEGPYLTSRYDTVDGHFIEPLDRIGIFDRKLRIVSENVSNESDWINWGLIAAKSVYGYEWQGDSLLIARENMFLTFCEFFEKQFLKQPPVAVLEQLAYILSWNLWQMDGMKFVVPNSCHDYIEEIVTIFETNEIKRKCPGCVSDDIYSHNGIRCLIMDWETERPVEFISLLKKR